MNDQTQLKMQMNKKCLQCSWIELKLHPYRLTLIFRPRYYCTCHYNQRIVTMI